MQRSDFVQWAAVAVLLVGFLLLWIEAGFGGETATIAAVDVANVVAALAAGAACWWRGGQEPGKPGKGWRLLAAGCLAWGLGVLYVTYFDLVVEAGVPLEDRSIPFPSIADAGYLAFVPLAMLGVLLIPRGIFTTGLRLRHALDAGVVAVALLMACWVLVLRGLWHADLGSPLETLILLAYPWGDFLILALCVFAWEFVPREEREGLLVLIVGLGLFALADMGFYVLIVRDATGADISPINALWPAGFVAIAMAAVRRPLPVPRDERVREPTRGLLPLASALGLLVLGTSLVSHGLQAGIAVLGTLFVGLLLARFALSRASRSRVRTQAARHPGEP